MNNGSVLGFWKVGLRVRSWRSSEVARERSERKMRTVTEVGADGMVGERGQPPNLTQGNLRLNLKNRGVKWARFRLG